MNDSIIANMVDSLTTVHLAQIEADKEIALAAMQVSNHTPIDWEAVIILSIIFILPPLIVFCYLGYKKYLQHQRRKLNDDLIVRLAQQGQKLTPELIDTIRQEEKKNEQTNPSNISNEAYQKLCTGGALCIGGAIVCLRNRFFGLIMLIVGLFTVAQGLALWLSSRNKK